MFNELKMENEKLYLTQLLLTHLERKSLINLDCENYSCFFEEKEERERCLLDEYLNKKGTFIFNLEEAKTICPRFRIEKDNKCHTNGKIPALEISPETELRKLLKNTKRRFLIEI